MTPGITSGGTASQTVPAKVLDCDTITQVKEKLVEQTWKGTSFSQRPHVDSLNLGQSATVKLIRLIYFSNMNRPFFSRSFIF